MRKWVAFSLALAAAGSVWAGQRYTGNHPYGDSYGLVDAFNGTTNEIWPFRAYNTPGIVVGDTHNGHARNGNVAVTYPGTITVDNTETGANLGDDGDKRVYTSSPAWAPPEIYQIEVWGASSSTIEGLTPGATYIAEIHFAETYNGNQNRVFRCRANGETLVCGVRPGNAGLGAAHVFSAQVQADSEGKIAFVITNYSDNGIWGGYAVWGTSAPTWTNPSIVGDGADVKATWSGGKDVLRYYVESSDAAEGPWTNVATLPPGSTSYTGAGAYNPATEKYWRVVASNGVGTVVQQVKLGDASSVVYTDLATRGETVASAPAVNYRVATAGTGDLNKLGSATTEVGAYVNGQPDATTLALAAGETLKAGTLGVLSGAGDLTIGETVGTGTVAPLAGNLNFDVNGAGSVLTVNAPVAKQTDGDAIVKFGGGAVKLAGGTDIAKVSIGSGSVEVSYGADAEFDKVLTGAGTFVKTGAGTLTVQNDSPDFAGTFQIKEGTVLAGKDGMASAFGDGKATIEVKPGATLDVGNPNATVDNAVNFGATKVVIAGTGANGTGGALVNSSGRSQYNTFRYLELADDATVHATGRFDVRMNGGAATDLHGHTLTKEGDGMFVFTNVPVDAGGEGAKIVVNKGSLGAEVNTAFTGAGSFEMANDAAFDFYDLSPAVTWPLLVKSTGGRFTCRNGNYDGRNNWAGPVTLEGRLNVQANDNTSLRVTGKISGSGSLGRTGGGAAGIVKIENTENDYTGGTEANYGLLYFPSAAALPGFDEPGRVTVSNQGKLVVKLGEGGANGWSAGEVASLRANATAPDGANGAIVVDTDGQDLEAPAGAADKPIGPGKAGEGTYVVHTHYPNGGGVYVEGGELVLDNAEYNRFGMLEVARTGTLRVRGAEIDCGDVDTRVGYVNPANADNPERARLILEDGAYYHTELKPYQTAGHGLYIGNGGQHAQGILEVLDGATISNRIGVAMGSYSQGAVYQRGGEIVNWAGHGCDGRVSAGDHAYGYWEISGGETYFMGYSQVAVNPAGAGILSIKDGAFHQKTELGGFLGVSRGGAGVIHQTGGTFDSVDNLHIGDSNDNNANGGSGVYTLAGGTAVMGTAENPRGVQLCQRNNFVGQLNLNGGELTAGSVWKQAGDNSQANVTFNGGTLKSMTSNKNIFGDEGYYPTTVRVFGNGAIFDTDGKDTNTQVPLLAPEGRGVKAIRYTAENLIGPPNVSITGGGGTGATAIADFDSTSGKVKGIIITCPGWGYTSKPTVTLFGGGKRTDQTVTIPETSIDLGVNAAGPVVKKGEGSLNLGGENTFVGVTVEGGVLSAMGKGVTLAPGPLTLAGGTFRAPSFAATELVVEGEADTVSTLDAKLTLSGVKQSARQPGLYMLLQNGDIDNNLTATAENCTDVVNSLAYVDTALNDNVNPTIGYPLNNNTINCVYDGYIWNRTGETATWTFAEHFDDYVYLTIDGGEVLNNGAWDGASLGTVTVDPGPHTFHLIVHQGGGDSGPSGGGGDGSAWMRETGLGIAVDFQGRGEQVAANFQKLEDDGSGVLFTLTTDDVASQDFAPDAAVHVNGGTLKLAQSQPGLFGGFIGNNDWRTVSAPSARVWSDLDYANTPYQEADVVDGVQNRDIACVYEGYIWNHDTRDVTWTFVENFDDNVYLKIDDTVVLDNGAWNEPTKANITLAPGPHAIHLGVRQGGGGSGPSGQGWMNDNRIGIGIDFEGRDADVVGNYVPLSATAQGGTLPLLTTAPYLPGEQLIPADTPFAISGGAKVDLDGATFTLNNVTSAAGGFENGSLVLDGAWTLDYADVVAGKTLTVSAADLSHTTIAFTGTPVLDRSARYPILVSEEALTGLPTVETELPRGWGVKVRGGTSLNLMYSGGTILYLR